MRRDTVESLARCLAPVAVRHGLDRFAVARHVLFGLRDPERPFAERIAAQISVIVSDIDDDNGGRDLHIDTDDARRAWINLIKDEMCQAMVQRALAADITDVRNDLDKAARNVIDALSSPSAKLVEGFRAAAAQVVETWDYRPLDQIMVSVERSCEEWNDLLACLAR